MLLSRPWLSGWWILVGVALCRAQASNKAELLGVDNYHMIDDITQAINYGDMKVRKVYFTRDCEELYQLGHRQSGVYVIRPEGTTYLVVQCLMYDCGGWTVIQRNTYDTPITWSETWSAYEHGFGDIERDHYLGNKFIHFLTTQKWNKVRFLLTDAANGTSFTDYDSFYLTGAADKYRLRLGASAGEAGDSMASADLKNLHDNMRFSTFDDDNDRQHNNNCADKEGGGWWYDSCYNAQLNRNNGLHWQTLCQHNCRRSLILIRPVHMYCHRA